jgi:4-hydroxyphenylpyruvate dioxygenase
VAGFGYEVVAYRGPEQRVRDPAMYLLGQKRVRLVLTSAMGPDSDIARHVTLHGDGVRDLALWVDDAREALRDADDRHARRQEGESRRTVLHRCPGMTRRVHASGRR